MVFWIIWKHLEGQCAIFCPSLHFPERVPQLTSLRCCSVGCRVESVVVQSAFFVMPGDCVCQEVLKSFLYLCALGLEWVEKHSGAFARESAFPSFSWHTVVQEASPEWRWGMTTASHWVWKEISLRARIRLLFSAVISTIKYNSIVESQLWSRF